MQAGSIPCRRRYSSNLMRSSSLVKSAMLLSNDDPEFLNWGKFGQVRQDFEVKTPSKLLKNMAIPAGLEPATRGVEIRYSIQLSYGTVAVASGPAVGPEGQIDAPFIAPSIGKIRCDGKGFCEPNLMNRRQSA